MLAGLWYSSWPVWWWFTYSGQLYVGHIAAMCTDWLYGSSGPMCVCARSASAKLAMHRLSCSPVLGCWKGSCKHAVCAGVLQGLMHGCGCVLVVLQVV